MSGLNRAQLIGRLGRDPESRRLNNGSTVVNLRLATSETWKDKHSGERKEATEWHQIVIYNESLAKVAEQYLKKGAMVMIEGKITTRKWQDQSGADRYTTEIVLGKFGGSLLLLPSGRDSDSSGDRSGERRETYGEHRGGAAPAQRPAPARTIAEDIDDDIPF